MTDDLKFLGGSTRDNATQYAERKRFLNYFKGKGYPLLDTLYEHRLYGFLNPQGHVVMPVGTTSVFGNDSGVTTGLNFVVDLYNKFRDLYRRDSNITLPAAIPDLVPKKSYENFDENYENLEVIVMRKLIPILRDMLGSRQVELLEFIEAIEEAIFGEQMVDMPLTKSGYALSSFSSAYYTGLYVDTATGQDGSVDFTKPDFYEDENFECYVKLAGESGFFVDANSPWRLILNLESPITQHRILNGRDPEEFNKFFYDVYTINVGYDDYWALRSFCQKLFIEYYKESGHGLSSVPRLEDQSRWLEFLLINKFRELSLILNPAERSMDLFLWSFWARSCFNCS